MAETATLGVKYQNYVSIQCGCESPQQLRETSALSSANFLRNV